MHLSIELIVIVGLWLLVGAWTWMRVLIAEVKRAEVKRLERLQCVDNLLAQYEQYRESLLEELEQYEQ